MKESPSSIHSVKHQLFVQDISDTLHRDLLNLNSVVELKCRDGGIKQWSRNGEEELHQSTASGAVWSRGESVFGSRIFYTDQIQATSIETLGRDSNNYVYRIGLAPVSAAVSTDRDPQHGTTKLPQNMNQAVVCLPYL
jgi:hypothetical protein